MPYKLLIWPAAAESLARLRKDPALAPALRAVERTRQRLEADPFSPRLGTVPFMTDELGGVSATPAGLDDWYIFWQRGAEPRTLYVVEVDQLRR